MKKEDLDIRFGRKVRKTDACWLWTGGIGGMGYGAIGVDGKVVGAHRISYELHKGQIPKGLLILHSCHNPRCVNPNHLRLGTHQDNMDDMNRADRCQRIKGEEHFRAKLTKQDVIGIKWLLQSKLTQKLIGEAYNVTKQAINRISKRKCWGHV